MWEAKKNGLASHTGPMKKIKRNGRARVAGWQCNKQGSDPIAARSMRIGFAPRHAAQYCTVRWPAPNFKSSFGWGIGATREMRPCPEPQLSAARARANVPACPRLHPIFALSQGTALLACPLPPHPKGPLGNRRSGRGRVQTRSVSSHQPRSNPGQGQALAKTKQRQSNRTNGTA